MKLPGYHCFSFKVARAFCTAANQGAGEQMNNLLASYSGLVENEESGRGQVGPPVIEKII